MLSFLLAVLMIQPALAELPAICGPNHDLQCVAMSAASDDPPPEKEVAEAMSANADIQARFNFYVSEKYEYTRYDAYLIEAVGEDFEAIAAEEDHAKYLEESQKLKEDFGKLDAFDDSLRRNWLI